MRIRPLGPIFFELLLTRPIIRISTPALARPRKSRIMLRIADFRIVNEQLLSRSLDKAGKLLAGVDRAHEEGLQFRCVSLAFKVRFKEFFSLLGRGPDFA